MAKRLRAKPSNTFLLLIGTGLILALVAFAGLNRPLPTYLVASSNLAPGMQLTEANVMTVDLDLGILADRYATLDEASGEFLLQPVAVGELIPLRILGEPLSRDRTSLRFTPDLKPAAQINSGSRVAIWQVIETEDGFQSQLLVPTAVVTDLAFGDGLFAGELPEVEVTLTETLATLVLQAISSDAKIYILPLP